jgi:hypothetical protein
MVVTPPWPALADVKIGIFPTALDPSKLLKSREDRVDSARGKTDHLAKLKPVAPLGGGL